MTDANQPFTTLEVAEALARRSPLDLATLLFPDTKRWPHVVLLNEHLLALTEYRLTAQGPVEASEVNWFYKPKGAREEDPFLPALDVYHIPTDAEAYEGRTPRGPVVFRLQVSMMPRAGKSRIITEAFIPWLHLKFPGIKTGLGTYSDEFGRSWGTAMRDKLTEMREIYPFLPQPHNGYKEPAVEQRLQTAEGPQGMAYFSGRGGSITGKTLHVRVGDDWIKNSQEAESKTERAKAKKFYRTTWKTRATAGPEIGLPIPLEVLMGTRWHVDDVINAAIADDPDGFCVVVIPALATDPDNDPLSRQYGEAHPNAAGLRRDELLALKANEPEEFACLYQGDPQAEDSGLIPPLREGNFYSRIPGRPGEFLLPDGTTIHEDDCQRFTGIDMAATKRTSADFTVLVHALYHAGRGLTLITDMFHDRVTTDEYEPILLPLLEQHGPAVSITEDITFGRVFGNILEKEGHRVEYHPAGRDKVARMAGSRYPKMLRRGEVLFPRTPANEAPPHWMEAMTDEARSFPTANHDDIMDALAFVAWWINELKPRRPQADRKPADASAHQRLHDARMEANIAAAERETAIANGRKRRSTRAGRNRQRFAQISRVSRRRR